MAVSITLKGKLGSDEYKDALVLKEIFEKGIPKNVDGRILIISNTTLFGQDIKDVDIIAIGSFEKYSLNLKTRRKYQNKENKEKFEAVVDEKIEMRNIFFSDFCFVFECKKHSAEYVQLDGLNLLVKYDNYFKDITYQSEKQKYALYLFLKDRLKFTPYIANFIWLRNVTMQSIMDLVGGGNDGYSAHNYLPTKFSVEYLFQLACVQNLPYTYFDYDGIRLKGYSIYGTRKRNEQIDFDHILDTFNIFERVKNGVGQM